MSQLKKIKNQCQLKGCYKDLYNGGKVGVDFGGRSEEILVCASHAWLLMTSPPNSYKITEDYELKPLPAKMHFDMKPKTN